MNSIVATIRDSKYSSVLFYAIGLLSVTTLTFFFIVYPVVSTTALFYLFLGYCLITAGKTGIVLLSLSFPLVRNSYAAVSGSFMPILFYFVFMASLMGIFYANVLGFKLRFPHLAMDKVIVAFSFYIVVSIVIFSSERAYGIKKLKEYVMNIILFYLPILLVRNEDDLEKMFDAIFYFGIFFTLFSLLSLLDLEPFFGNSFAGRFNSLGINPIWMARYYSYAILVELYYIIRYLPKWERHIGKIILLVSLVFLQLLLAMLTGSRGPLLAMFFAIGFIILFNFRFNFKLSYLIGAGVAAAALFFVAISFVPANMAERLLSQESSGQSTSMIRLLLNIEALIMFWENKVFGSGFGGFNIFFYKYPHNIFTETLAELGIVGFSMLAGVVILAIKYLIEASKHLKQINLYFLITVLAASFANANLSGHIGSNYFFFLSLSLIYAARQMIDYEKDTFLSRS